MTQVGRLLVVSPQANGFTVLFCLYQVFNWFGTDLLTWIQQKRRVGLVWSDNFGTQHTGTPVLLSLKPFKQACRWFDKLSTTIYFVWNAVHGILAHQKLHNRLAIAVSSHGWRGVLHIYSCLIRVLRLNAQTWCATCRLLNSWHLTLYYITLLGLFHILF
jgi:hypothetical protein